MFATQLCALTGADCVGVVSSDEKGELVKQLGAKDFINRNEFAGMMRKGGESAEEEKARFKEMRRFDKRVKEILGGDKPDIVFEHVGKATFPTSVFVVKPFGKVVICGATSGFDLDFDVRYLWMRQKQIIGSHFANAWECTKANDLIRESKIRPVLWKTMPFEGVAEAHQLMYENAHSRQDRDPRGRDRDRPGQDRRGRRSDPRRGRQLMAAGVVHLPLYATGFRGDDLQAALELIAPISTKYGATRYEVFRSRDDRYKFLLAVDFDDQARLGRLLVRPRVHRVPRRLQRLVPGAAAVRLERPRDARRGARAGHGRRHGRRSRLTTRVGDPPEAVDEPQPLLGLQAARVDAAAARAAQRAEADVDVVGVVGHRQRGRRARIAHEADDLRGRHRALQRQQAADRRRRRSSPAPWLPRIDWPLIFAMSTPLPDECWETLPVSV